MYLGGVDLIPLIVTEIIPTATFPVLQSRALRGCMPYGKNKLNSRLETGKYKRLKNTKRKPPAPRARAEVYCPKIYISKNSCPTPIPIKLPIASPKVAQIMPGAIKSFRFAAFATGVMNGGP